MRPTTLAEVASATARGESFDRSLADFLDDFYATPRPDALSPTPQLLAPALGELGRLQDAYLAAAHRLSIPAWVATEDRCLHRPWFASPLAALRAGRLDWFCGGQGMAHEARRAHPIRALETQPGPALRTPGR